MSISFCGEIPMCWLIEMRIKKETPNMRRIKYFFLLNFCIIRLPKQPGKDTPETRGFTEAS
jgi:hypothetical protein